LPPTTCRNSFLGSFGSFFPVCRASLRSTFQTSYHERELDPATMRGLPSSFFSTLSFMCLARAARILSATQSVVLLVSLWLPPHSLPPFFFLTLFSAFFYGVEVSIITVLNHLSEDAGDPPADTHLSGRESLVNLCRLFSRFLPVFPFCPRSYAKKPSID